MDRRPATWCGNTYPHSAVPDFTKISYISLAAGPGIEGPVFSSITYKSTCMFTRIKLFTSLVFLLVFHTAEAQFSDTIHMKAIPHPLYWDIKPDQFSIINGVLQMTAGSKTDMFRDPNVTYNTDNAPKLLFVPDEDFVLSASIQHSFKNKWDGGAIVLMEDSLNWIKFCFEKDYTGARRVVSVVTKDISDDCNSAAIPGDRVFFKMAKAGNVITLYYSLDGKKWLLIRHLQFNNKKNIRIGFLAQSPTGDKCVVRFGNIQYAAKRIKDPYAGE